MAYVGNTPAAAYTSIAKQDITGDGGTSYTLDHSVANENEIEVFVNNVRQEPSVAYTVSGTALTMTGNVAASDDFYVVFQGKAIQTTSHPEGQDLQARDGTFAGAVTVNGAFTSQGIDDNATSTAMTLNSSNNLLVGTTSTGAATASNGAYITPDGQIIGRSDGIVSYLNRRSTDGQILQFMKDGTQVGNIGSVSGVDIVIGSGDTGIRFQQGDDCLRPTNSAGSTRDGAIDLGISSSRFRNLYLSGEGGGSAAVDVRQGSAKVWVNFNGTGTISARDSYNLSSLTDNGTGRYTITPSNIMDNSNGSLAVQGSNGSDGYNRALTGFMEGTNNFDCTSFNTGTNSKVDLTYQQVAAFGDLA